MGRVAAKRVLVVGDRPDIVAVLGELLTRYGYEVQRSSHSAASVVLAQPKEASPHVMVLDTGRPLSWDVSVLECARHTMHGRLPVIVLATSTTEEQEAELERLGVSRLLWKPAPAAALLSAIAEALN